ncbi:histone acetyltransferase [Mucor circinelloides]
MVSSSLPLFPQLAEMSDEEKYGIVARFIPCDLCSTCKGWHPYESNQANCQCGHDTFHHIDNAQDLDRRLKVAFRLNELLEEKGKIDDYDYEDQDILSLKKQILYNASRMESISDGSSLSPQDLKRNRDAASMNDNGQDESSAHDSKRMRSETGNHTDTENENENEDEEEDDEEFHEEEEEEEEEESEEEEEEDEEDEEEEEESEDEEAESDKEAESENDREESDDQADDTKQADNDEADQRPSSPPKDANHDMEMKDQTLETNDVKELPNGNTKTSQELSHVKTEKDVDMEPSAIDNGENEEPNPPTTTTTNTTSPAPTTNTTNTTATASENDNNTNNDKEEEEEDAIIPDVILKREDDSTESQEQDQLSRMLSEFMPTEKKESPAMIEERQGDIRTQVVLNDGARQSMILLTGLKNIFQKQLPKMPKEYIARLVYDRNHRSIALIRNPHKVIGGICYRPFDEQEFAEIVFCAVASTEQVKGYGSFIMNHLKDYVSGHTNVKHFLTYADNYAVGYFRKQGFTTEITLDKRKWVGYIKDYEGGTIMQCTMVPRVKYLQVQDILGIQRNAILKKIQEQSTEHVTYPGLRMPINKNGKRSIDPLEVPGIKDSGWTPEMDILSNKPRHSPYYHQMVHIVEEMQNYTHAWPFLEPVSVDDVADYYDIVKDPMDLATLEENVKADAYPTMEDFVKDTQKIFENCKLYNAEDTEYAKCSAKLERFFNEKVRAATRAKNE